MDGEKEAEPSPAAEGGGTDGKGERIGSYGKLLSRWGSIEDTCFLNSLSA